MTAKSGLARHAHDIAARALEHALAQKEEEMSRAEASPFPPRNADAPTGSEFMKRLESMTLEEREAAIAEQIEAGNVPSALREPKTISIEAKDKDGNPRTVEVEVLPDYLAIGSDEDNVRIPMTPMTAQKLADKLGMSLPTKKLVDDIHDRSSVKIMPWGLNRRREDPATFAKHDSIVDRQLEGHSQSELTSGHKKDIVRTNLLKQRPDRVAIYGWHQKNGEPIQPLSTVHHDKYVDYSHGVRFVSNTVHIDGVPHDIDDVLADPNLAPLLSHEGPITTKIRTE